MLMLRTLEVIRRQYLILGISLPVNILDLVNYQKRTVCSERRLWLNWGHKHEGSEEHTPSCERGKSPFKPLQRARLPLEECESGIAMDRWPRYWLMTDDSRWLQPSTAIFWQEAVTLVGVWRHASESIVLLLAGSYSYKKLRTDFQELSNAKTD